MLNRQVQRKWRRRNLTRRRCLVAWYARGQAAGEFPPPPSPPAWSLVGPECFPARELAAGAVTGGAAEGGGPADERTGTVAGPTAEAEMGRVTIFRITAADDPSRPFLGFTAAQAQRQLLIKVSRGGHASGAREAIKRIAGLEITLGYPTFHFHNPASLVFGGRCPGPGGGCSGGLPCPFAKPLPNVWAKTSQGRTPQRCCCRESSGCAKSGAASV